MSSNFELSNLNMFEVCYILDQVNTTFGFFDDFNQRSIMRADDLPQHQMYKCMWNIENLPFSMANLCIFFCKNQKFLQESLQE